MDRAGEALEFGVLFFRYVDKVLFGAAVISLAIGVCLGVSLIDARHELAQVRAGAIK